MTPDETSPSCGPACGCGPVDRRTFLGAAGLGIAGSMLGRLPAVAGPFAPADFEKLVPADKKLKPDWLKSLTARGEPTVCKGDELAWIGMPVGGIAAGQLYLGGDGTLWHWDIFNLPQPANFTSYAAPNYAHPPRPSSPLLQKFGLRVTAAGKSHTRPLDRTGFRDVSFRGQYPVGTVTYADPDCPVQVTLEAFSPFIPLSFDDSNLPATVLHFTLANTGRETVTVDLLGALENAVCLDSGKPGLGRRRTRVLRDPGLTILHHTAEPLPPGEPKRRPDILFEDFEKDTYAGWTTEGTAFGKGPVKWRNVPNYQGHLGGKGDRVVNSHASAPGNDVGSKDSATGKLTSKPFTLDRDFIHFLIGGGNHPGKTCLNLLVAGKPVRTATGKADNRLSPASWDVRDLQGREAVLEIVDAHTGAWGNIGVDHIVFSDDPALMAGDLAARPDFGSLALALLNPQPADFALCSLPQKLLDWFNLDNLTAAEAVRPFGDKLTGALGRTLTLKPGDKADATFLLTWYFPNLPAGRFTNLQGHDKLRRSYGARFDSAAAVARHVAKDFDRLAGATRLWNRTYYDSTLPHWLLDRAFIPIDCLATATCYHFTDGRFYGYEGTYCCDGTCTHVWQYAQGLARIFPSVERGLREHVDFGLSFHPDTGAIDYRGEYARHVAHDGQAGTILRAYREHLTAPDDAYLKRVWPRVKKATEYLLARDPDRDGLLDGEQYNTLDASWFGHIAWISALYLAAVRAAAAMAKAAGDKAFAAQCDALADKGRQRLTEVLFNGEYFIQKVDPKHPQAINTNDGCHIDQVYGQQWAFQVGLPRVTPEKETRSALESLWRYNFTPDVGPYRQNMKAIPGGRWYAMPGEGGLLMCTWPRGGADKAGGKGQNTTFIGYFNECMAGFEYQAAAHMVWEGLADPSLVEKGLAVTRMIHDRYHPGRHNPYNDVECSDHYARAMSSYGVFLAACGFEYDGPKGHLGFAPRLTPDDFRAPFTAAEGWGTFRQSRQPGRLDAALDLRWGRLRLRHLALHLPAGVTVQSATAGIAGRKVQPAVAQDGPRVLLTLPADETISAGQSAEFSLTFAS